MVHNPVRCAPQAEATGRGAQTVYRDSSGRVVANAEELRKLKEAEAAAKKPQAETPEWGGGLKQVLPSAVKQHYSDDSAFHQWHRIAESPPAQPSQHCNHCQITKASLIGALACILGIRVNA